MWGSGSTPQDELSTVSRQAGEKEEGTETRPRIEDQGSGPAREEAAGKPPGAWWMALVVSASAVCGGVAVVLWNRRLLARMRDLHSADAEPKKVRWEDDD